MFRKEEGEFREIFLSGSLAGGALGRVWSFGFGFEVKV